MKRLLLRLIVGTAAGAVILAFGASLGVAARSAAVMAKAGPSVGRVATQADCSMTTALRVAKPFLWTPLLSRKMR